MTRKIIQISAVPVNPDYGISPIVYALCNDGTIWEYASNDHWSKLDSIPQTDINNDIEIEIRDKIKTGDLVKWDVDKHTWVAKEVKGNAVVIERGDYSLAMNLRETVLVSDLTIVKANHETPTPT